MGALALVPQVDRLPAGQRGKGHGANVTGLLNECPSEPRSLGPERVYYGMCFNSPCCFLLGRKDARGGVHVGSPLRAVGLRSCGCVQGQGVTTLGGSQ